MATKRNDADPNAFVFEGLRQRINAPLEGPPAQPHSPDIGDLQLLWWHHVASGCSQSADVVLAMLDAVCRTRMTDWMPGGMPAVGASFARPNTLRDDAKLLELLTWVWRVQRSDKIRARAERIAERVVRDLVVAGAGFASSAAAEQSGDACPRGEPVPRDATVRADWNGLMLVALLEAGSVLERRDWLGLTMKMFDALVTRLAAGPVLHHNVFGDDVGEPGRQDDYASMIRAAMRLFTAFGRPRYLAQAETWAATLEAQFWTDDAGYGATSARALALRRDSEATDENAMSDNVRMINVLVRLHDLTGREHYRQRAQRLADLIGGHGRTALVPAAAVAALVTCATRVTIKVSGKPRDPDTRALMRAALDYGLPDRLVLGPGAGERPRDQLPAAVEIVVGTTRLPAMGLDAMLGFSAPGGLHQALLRSFAPGSGPP